VASPRPAKRPHYGRTRTFETVRIAAWRSRDDKWHQVEDGNGDKIGRYPSALQAERAKVIIIVGETEHSPDGGITWKPTGELKWLNSHTPFTKKHTIDDFAIASMDYYGERYR